VPAIVSLGEKSGQEERGNGPVQETLTELVTAHVPLFGCGSQGGCWEMGGHDRLIFTSTRQLVAAR